MADCVFPPVVIGLMSPPTNTGHVSRPDPRYKRADATGSPREMPEISGQFRAWIRPSPPTAALTPSTCAATAPAHVVAAHWANNKVTPMPRKSSRGPRSFETVMDELTVEQAPFDLDQH